MRICALVLLWAGVASADPDTGRYRKDADARLAAEVDTTNATCGIKLAASYDWSKEASKPEPAGLGPTVCAEAAKAIADVCNGHPDAKAKLKKLKKLDCRFDASVTKKKTSKKGTAADLGGTPPVPHTWLELGKGTLSVRFDWSAANTRSELAKYLPKLL
jgi:hypothetical protein